MDNPPLTLYIHVPWCRHKCPYCDFHSTATSAPVPERIYVDALLEDLDEELRTPAVRRPIRSVFIGGGTPSLLSGAAIARLLTGVRARAPLVRHTEITLEANPGTVDEKSLAAYLAAGVTRLSLGVQSLDVTQLRRLGRIHDPEQARAAVTGARRAGCTRINLDLMFGLPQQTLAQARADLAALLDLAPDHVAYYQLTIEPDTLFGRNPPPLPDEELCADMQEQGCEMLTKAGFTRYEVSAYARPGQQCRHHLNYWTFGDYLGLGAGAHGKHTNSSTGIITRYVKQPAVRDYVFAPCSAMRRITARTLTEDDLIVEFTLNALRLVGGVSLDTFVRRTGLAVERIAAPLARARAAGLLIATPGRMRTTPRGLAVLDETIQFFFS